MGYFNNVLIVTDFYSTSAANHALIPQAIQQIMNKQEQVSFVLLEKNKMEILQEIENKTPCLGIVSFFLISR